MIGNNLKAKLLEGEDQVELLSILLFIKMISKQLTSKVYTQNSKYLKIQKTMYTNQKN